MKVSGRSCSVREQCEDEHTEGHQPHLRRDGRQIDQALEEGVRKAMVEHEKDGLPVVIEGNGTIEWVKPGKPGALNSFRLKRESHR